MWATGNVSVLVLLKERKLRNREVALSKLALKAETVTRHFKTVIQLRLSNSGFLLYHDLIASYVQSTEPGIIGLKGV